MQEVDLLGASPVTAVERRVAAIHQRTGNGFAIAIGQHEHDAVRQRSRDLAEKALVEGRNAPFIIESPGVEVTEIAPVSWRCAVTVKNADLHARLADPAPLLENRLALARRQPPEKIVEVRIALVVPVKLAIVPDQKPLLLQIIDLSILGKKQVKAARPRLACQRQGRLQQQRKHPLPIGIAAEHALPATGRVGHGRDQLRKIGMPRSLVGVGPGVVEDEFTVGVGFFVQGHGTGQAIAVVDRDVPRQPAEVLSDTAVRLHGLQEFVAHQRVVVPDERVPVVGRDRGDIAVNLDLQGLHHLFMVSGILRQGGRRIPHRWRGNLSGPARSGQPAGWYTAAS